MLHRSWLPLFSLRVGEDAYGGRQPWLKTRKASGDPAGASTRLPVPRQQVIQLERRMVSDAGKDIGKLCLRVDIVELELEIRPSGCDD
jgi:hypothetical protein